MSDRDPLRSLLAVSVALAALSAGSAYAQAAQHHDALPNPYHIVRELLQTSSWTDDRIDGRQSTSIATAVVSGCSSGVVARARGTRAPIRLWRPF